MVEKDADYVTMNRRGYLKGLAASSAGVGALSVATGSARAGSGDEQSAEDTHDLDGDELYLVFGADSSERDLDGWVDDHCAEINGNGQESLASVIQYQDVSQLNVTQQGYAVSIAIDGGEATAIQEAEQSNVNTQEGTAESIAIDEETRDETFTDPTTVYVVFAEETGTRTFTGWVAKEDSYQNEQSARATIDQDQKVDQLNYSSQSAAVALAEDCSHAQAYQQSWQTNENYQHADAVAAAIGDADEQTADAEVEQAQEVGQLNVSEQGVAIAIAVGKDSVAEAYQQSSQTNLNEQVAEAAAIAFDARSITDVLDCGDMVGELPEDVVSRSDTCKNQSNTQEASADIVQGQQVGQENINLQNAAVAAATDDSSATARQVSYQANFNAQVASAEALTVEEGSANGRAVLNGANASEDQAWALAYENGDVDQQTAAAEISQLQFVQQLNVNEQLTAIAIAGDSGEATAEQVSYETNENIQLAEARAASVGSGDSDCDKKKDGKDKNGKDKNGKDKTDSWNRQTAGRAIPYHTMR
ncbi:hypothetical protein [Saliphagus sp. LR7]|uniref:hypothetical protein n=1 Tax=Saliphagus sp. LR7 TaxID=2282654 RepID=UPI001E617FB6|nr:hypothetical protein [Saliphagus sp. LR7]